VDRIGPSCSRLFLSCLFFCHKQRRVVVGNVLVHSGIFCSLSRFLFLTVLGAVSCRFILCSLSPGDVTALATGFFLAPMSSLLGAGRQGIIGRFMWGRGGYWAFFEVEPTYFFFLLFSRQCSRVFILVLAVVPPARHLLLLFDRHPTGRLLPLATS